MAFERKDRVKDTTTTTGTGTVTLTGTAPSGYRAVSAAHTDGATVRYVISAGAEWEVGEGVYTASGTTLSRVTVFASSNAGALVNFSAGTKDVITTLTANEVDELVKGPASATADSLARFDGTTGKLLKDGAVIGTDVASLAANTFTGDQTLSGGAKFIATEVHSIWVPASAMVSRTTSGAALGSVETATNKVMIRTLDFDTAANEYAQFTVRMPKSWNKSTVSAQVIWSHPATATNFGVVWKIQAVALSDNDAADAAFGTAQSCTDTGGTTDNIYHSPVSSAITIGGSPVEGDFVVFQVYRDVADGEDTLAVDARLHGVLLTYTTNVCTDA